MNSSRSRGYVGSSGTYAPPALSTPSIATTSSADRSRCSPTPHLRPHPQPAQMVREPIGAPVQLAIRQLPVRGPQCQGLGRLPHTPLHEEAGVSSAPGSTRVAFQSTTSSRRSSEPSGDNPRERLPEIARHRRQEMAPVPHHPLRRHSVEPRPVVAHPERQLAPRHHRRRDEEVRLLPRVDLLHREPGRAHPERLVERIVLEHHDGIEQPLSARHLAPALDLHERRVLVLPQLHRVLLQPLQPWQQALLRRHPHPHRQRVDEEAHHPLGARQIRRSPGDRHPEDHIVHTTIAPRAASAQAPCTSVPSVR